ncbi:hypothetical protein SNEBB_007021 [Seison nebaliae]|nr:hypothetical protein SNEBB_007021 [Seison nebaliae]
MMEKLICRIVIIILICICVSAIKENEEKEMKYICNSCYGKKACRSGFSKIDCDNGCSYQKLFGVPKHGCAGKNCEYEGASGFLGWMMRIFFSVKCCTYNECNT